MNRKKSRQCAMKILYQMSISKETVEECIQNFIENTEENIKILDLEYIREIINGVEENKSTLDEKISKYLIKWKINRLSKVDLCILRICTYEMLFKTDIPYKVAINEAIELAKEYSGSESPSFINAVLDKFVKNEGIDKKEINN